MHLLVSEGKWYGSFAEILDYRRLCTSYMDIYRTVVHPGAVMEYYLVKILFIKPHCFVVFFNKVVIRTNEIIELYLFFVNFLLAK